MRHAPLKTLRVLQFGGGMLSRVAIVERRGKMLVLKDFSASHFLIRYTLGVFLAAWESRAYRGLEGVSGVPRFIGRASAHGLLLELVKGTNVSQAGAPTLEEHFFTALSRILESIRESGILHFDVARNVMVTDEGRPCLLDFGSSVTLPTWLGPINRCLANLRRLYDTRAVAKLKRRIAPHLLTNEEERLTASKLPWESFFNIAEQTMGWLRNRRHSSHPQRRISHFEAVLLKVLYALYLLSFKTLRITIHSPDGSKAAPEEFDFRKKIFAVFEGDLLALAGLSNWSPFATLVAEGRDGDWASEAARQAGLVVVRGSSLRGGAVGLRRLIHILQNSALPGVLSVDGPVGPAGEAKPGILLCARYAKRPVIPVGVFVSRAFALQKSWSGIYVPLPFSTVTIVLEDPLILDHSEASLEHYGHELNRRLNLASQRAASMGSGLTGNVTKQERRLCG
ncbi:MAG: DUF374 domain-containing protein [Acidobacteria bacterium]|nr:DUF374 domain-containing protein [Acidobacteriota bacterium]